jgi:hypothetical protein
MDVNSGERWSKIYISDTAGRWQIPLASFAGRDEVRQKAKELGLVERRKIW